jgi:hypothetical protein
MPNHDLVAVWEACRSEFEARDVDATTDTMVTDASVNRPDIEMSSPRLGQIRLPMKRPPISPIHASSLSSRACPVC